LLDIKRFVSDAGVSQDLEVGFARSRAHVKMYLFHNTGETCFNSSFLIYGDGAIHSFLRLDQVFMER
jgi:hypothetical protein